LLGPRDRIKNFSVFKPYGSRKLVKKRISAEELEKERLRWRPRSARAVENRWCWASFQTTSYISSGLPMKRCSLHRGVADRCSIRSSRSHGLKNTEAPCWRQCACYFLLQK